MMNCVSALSENIFHTNHFWAVWYFIVLKWPWKAVLTNHSEWNFWCAIIRQFCGIFFSSQNFTVTRWQFRLQSLTEYCVHHEAYCWNKVPSVQVNDVNFENMSNDDAVRILREIVSKPGWAVTLNLFISALRTLALILTSTERFFLRPISLTVAKCWDPSPRSYFTIPRGTAYHVFMI